MGKGERGGRGGEVERRKEVGGLLREGVGGRVGALRKRIVLTYAFRSYHFKTIIAYTLVAAVRVLTCCIISTWLPVTFINI